MHISSPEEMAVRRIERKKIYSVICPHCHAKINAACRSSKDRKYSCWVMPHNARVALFNASKPDPTGERTLARFRGEEK